MKIKYSFMCILVMLLCITISSCVGNANSNKASAPDSDSVAVAIGVDVDSDGNIIVTDYGAQDDYATIVEDVSDAMGANEDNEDIEKSLERLTYSISEYLKAADGDNETVKTFYEERVIKEVKYLDNHKDNMSPRQKEYYDKLNKIYLK